ncbi:6-phosphofructokinase [Sulfurimonas denitrificans DSM 1251]|uniref:ATP-dependent 6-phosphofructokinase n=1 Tax=Sulfurimonas denitrificans (strain ATCC 33889 / DSM 1251) TaxID=326298 RepID=PFKA_SULDN|nr:6-phosphofructokinase [Sulfurimonas denitrificans]Q30T53.1 RecName: Full=ATP-dependent 6-phosphofructokinase; Short=ATP-PFK; Short=Phosphofructokinase; AltName: Full=Phosphohexokinase [Sulfurimonas denitrificans DSM 1251]ABB43828.1 6-phosphofructokinase [Sulfurimonas denitrificans DSM 1251]
MKNIAILSSGGDVSGMNPAIKHFVEYALHNGLTPYFVYNGFEGLIDNKITKASHSDVAGIINRGGTILGSSRSKRFMLKNYREVAKKNLDALDIDMLIVLGGDGSFRGMDIFYKEHGVKFCGIPSTIDNDINGTIYCLGVDTALNVIKDSIDNIRDTASSFSRAFVIETMGRDCGYLALVSSLCSGAELCLIPEVEYNLSSYEDSFKEQIKNGRKYFIVIVSEGIKDNSKEIAEWLEQKVGIESRVTVLGHTQRGGTPSIYDRLMAYKFVNHAIDALLGDINSSVVCYSKTGFIHKDIDEITSQKYMLDPELLSYLKKF